MTRAFKPEHNSTTNVLCVGISPKKKDSRLWDLEWDLDSESVRPRVSLAGQQQKSSAVLSSSTGPGV